MHSHQHNIFHTPIWGFHLDNEKMHAVDYIDYILHMKENMPSVQKSNFGGWHSPDNLHTHGIFRELCENIFSCAQDILSPYTDRELKFVNMWAMVNDKYSYNANHVHEGLVSGVFYLKVPENSGRLILKDSALRSYSHRIKSNDFPIEPIDLALIFFPSWLEHYVEPSKSEEQRIAISFNIGEVL